MKTLLLALLTSFAFLVHAQIPDTATVRVEIDSLVQLNRSLVKERKYDEAHLVIQQAEEKCLTTFGEETALYGTVVFNKGRTFYFRRDMSSAEQFYILAKTTQERIIGKEHLDYAQTLKNLGSLYKAMGQYEKAEPFYLEVKTIWEKILGKEHFQYAGSLINLGLFYKKMVNYEKAETFLLEAKNIFEANEKLQEHPFYGRGLYNLGLLYRDMGQYEKAEPLFLSFKAIREKIVGKEHPDYAFILSGLGILYYYMGQYEKAELTYLEAKEIREKVLGKEHPKYAVTLMNLGILYGDMGQYKKEEALYLEAKAIQEKILSKEDPQYATNLDNLGRVYWLMGKYEKAEPFYREAKSIREKVLGKEHLKYAGSLVNLGLLYGDMGQYKKEEALYLEAKNIFEANENLLQHPFYMNCLNNLGGLYRAMGQYEKAEPLYLEAKVIREKVLGKEHPDYASSLNSLGNLYNNMGQKEKAETFYLEANEIRKVLLLNAARHLSERELLNYTSTFISNQNQLFSFASTQKAVAGTVYDNSLFHKGFLLKATQQVKRLAQSDSLSNELSLRHKGYNRRLAKVYSNPVSKRDSNTIANLEEKANQVEKELTRSVAGFGEALRQVNWPEVQAVLKPGEAAIEFIDYQFHNSNPTDSIMYAALLLRPGDQQPRLIPLFEEKSLDSLFALNQQRRADYVNDLYAHKDRGITIGGKPGKSLYQLIWQPLEKELEGISTVYYAPSGLLHRINLNAIAVEEEKTIADIYNIVQLQSTRSLVIPSSNNVINNTAVLYGGIQYESDSTAIAVANENYMEDRLASRGASWSFNALDATMRGGKWDYLKWTQKEVAAINPILKAADFKTEVLSDYLATEESFRALGQKKSSPRILHIATHGFFFPDPEVQVTKNNEEPVFKTSDHPMIRSGLIMAGGNHVWQGNPSLGTMEDGILTAYEISQMDLSQTELVVLSACETGLGDIQGNEGVYGLQRAFKIAGAKYLIMSLWQVPDRQTKDFMVTFYQHWLEDNRSIPDAFRKTQQDMKERFYDAYLWAGFVLVE